MNKREFVLGGCALVGAAGQAMAAGPDRPPGPVAASDRAARPPELAPDLSMAKWQHYLGHQFVAPGGSLRLTEVRAEPATGGLAEQFSLLFSAAPDQALTAGTHSLVHGTGQRIALFMQPAGASVQGRALFRAEFNLLG